ncbi:P120' protein [Metamycoplasma auris 15026]|uniref:p120' protein n=2 Tax=Metamycoplasma auris TaxID=51363 RepID=N9V186_9BACT|nr:P120' protein [Metamycoplasma auris 15026]
MSPKAKKGLIITGIISGVIAAPIALTLIPYGIQKSLANKNSLEAKQAFYEKQVSLVSKEIENKENKKAEINKQIATKKNEGELKDLKEELDKLITQIKEDTALYIVNNYELFKIQKSILENQIDLNFPTKEESKKAIDFYTKWIENLSKIKKDNLNQVSIAWVSGLKYSWEIIKELYESEIRLIGGQLSFAPEGAYPINSFANSFVDITNEKATKIKRNLEEGIKENVILSKVVIKNNIRSILKNFYTKELLEFISSNKKEESLTNIIRQNKNLDEETKKFHEFYVNKYYESTDHGLGENIRELKVYKTNVTNEVEDTIELIDNNDKKVLIYGLGITKKDLEANDVGINAIKGSASSTNGKKLYDIILKMSTTTNNSSQQIFEAGYKTTTTATKNMEATAKAIAKLITGNENSKWEPTIKYNPDGVAGKSVQDLTVKIRDDKGNINLTEFNKWMNQEQFFFGREGSNFYTKEKEESLLKEKSLEESISNFNKLGYAHLIDAKNANEKYGTITNKEFYLGALEAFKGYHQFRAATMDYGFSFFDKKVDKYGINVYDFKYRTESGVGEERPDDNIEKGTTGAFVFNPDPYFSLPKWSVTSFANHESVMGHHNQIQYARRYLKTINNLTIGNIFNYTSYIEGWALFMEWFGIEAGLYGTPDFESEDYYSLPKDFQYSHGITYFIGNKTKDKITNEDIKQIKELHGGVYWTLAANGQTNITDEKEHALKTAKLTNMLQYYGALNEAQLRNMRLAVDTAYHGEIKGESSLPKNASIKQVREFLTKNSALGVGDITSESKRYLNFPGQATSYNSGKEALLNLYDKVRKAKNLKRKDFLENKEAIKEFFNLLLETGALPLATIEEIINYHYNIK